MLDTRLSGMKRLFLAIFIGRNALIQDPYPHGEKHHQRQQDEDHHAQQLHRNRRQG